MESGGGVEEGLAADSALDEAFDWTTSSAGEAEEGLEP